MTSRLFHRFLNQIHKARGCITYSACRTLLSEAYMCNDTWKQRLQSSLLQNVDVGNFAVALQGKFDRSGEVKALDMDIFANKLEDLEPNQLDFAQNLFYRFRHTNESLLMSESIPYSLTRSLLAMGETDRLLSIMKDKINYGIFHSDFTANILMDNFIEHKQYREAASVAYDLMLQEDFSHPICRHLAWYSCYLRHKHWEPEEIEPKQEAEDEEIEYIKVNFITNPWFDDHFDLTKESSLLGKTLVAVARGDTSCLGQSCSLIGCGLYEKFDRGLELLRSIVNDKDASPVSLDSLTSFENSLVSVVTKEVDEEEKYAGSVTMDDVTPGVTQEEKDNYISQLQDLKSQLEAGGRIEAEFDAEKMLMDRVKQAINEREVHDIAEQKALFVEWEARRQTEFEEQLHDAKVKQTKDEILQRLVELQKREERLSYFEEIDQIELKQKGPQGYEELMKIKDEEQYVPAPSERGKSS